MLSRYKMSEDRKFTLAQRVEILEKLILNESVELDTITVFRQPTSDRAQYVTDQLSKLENGSRLLGIGNRGYTFVITKIDDNQYEYNYNDGSTDVYSPKLVINDCLRDRTNFYEIPRSVKLIKNNAINYEDDIVDVYRNGKKIYSGEEDYEPMKRERWRYNPNFGLYWLTDFSTSSIYIKVKK